jgi:hypothetical protein
MPRFYLHVCNGTGFLEDEEGVELSDVDAARAAAVAGARDLMASDVREGELDLASFIEVEDENHQWLFALLFLDALKVKGQDERPPSRHPHNKPQR